MQDIEAALKLILQNKDKICIRTEIDNSISVNTELQTIYIYENSIALKDPDYKVKLSDILKTMNGIKYGLIHYHYYFDKDENFNASVQDGNVIPFHLNHYIIDLLDMLLDMENKRLDDFEEMDGMCNVQQNK